VQITQQAQFNINMSQIKYSAGTIQRIDEQYFNLVLYKNANVVYKATINQAKASELIFKSKNIQLIK
jgi:hypothetical protein